MGGTTAPEGGVEWRETTLFKGVNLGRPWD